MPLIAFGCWLIGLVVGIKLALMYQAAVVVGLIISFIHQNANRGLEGVFVMIGILLMMIGIACGDIFYYLNYYNGPGIDWFWAFRP
jgi:hypothetical protein